VWNGYFRRAHGTGTDFVSIEQEYQLSFTDAEIVVQLEAIAGELSSDAKLIGSFHNHRGRLEKLMTLGSHMYSASTRMTPRGMARAIGSKFE
jgi:hypothetical protein